MQYSRSLPRTHYRSVPAVVFCLLVATLIEAGCSPASIHESIWGPAEKKIVVSPSHKAALVEMLRVTNLLDKSVFVKLREEEIIHDGKFVKIRDPEKLSQKARECIEGLDYDDFLNWTAVMAGPYFSIEQAREVTEFFETPVGRKIAKVMADGEKFVVGAEDKKTAEPYRESLVHFQSAAPRFLNKVASEKWLLASVMMSDCLVPR